MFATRDAYDYLFNTRYTVTKLKDAALSGRLFQGVDAGAGVAGRSLAWKVSAFLCLYTGSHAESHGNKLFLVPNEPLQDVAEVQAAPPLKPVQIAREKYKELLMEKMRAPDGGYEEGFTVPGLGTSPPRTEKSTGNLEKNNPLSLHDEVRAFWPPCTPGVLISTAAPQNPWREWFAAMELRKTILQDVERTYVSRSGLGCLRY